MLIGLSVTLFDVTYCRWHEIELIHCTKLCVWTFDRRHVGEGSVRTDRVIQLGYANCLVCGVICTIQMHHCTFPGTAKISAIYLHNFSQHGVVCVNFQQPCLFSGVSQSDRHPQNPVADVSANGLCRRLSPAVRFPRAVLLVGVCLPALCVRLEVSDVRYAA